MDLRHYASEALELDRARQYGQASGDYKPNGFWVSVLGERDWPSWCMDEGFALDSLGAEHEVVLSESANIRLIESVDGLDEFFEAYRTALYPGDERRGAINWAMVAEDYDGILITPYQYGRRLNAMWYYGWDCASGCIWNLDAIESVRVLESAGTERLDSER